MAFARLLQRLGTTFIKLGQHLSMRPDVFSPETISALATLQDKVESIPDDVARAAIEEGMGRTIEDTFVDFESAPFAAGSIAQIHRATLHDGRHVIVKLRRPGIVEQVAADVRLLRRTVAIAQAFVPPLRRHAPVALVDEVGSNLRLELDLMREARQAHRFAQRFAQSETAMVPDAVLDLCSSSVMVQVFSAGTRIDRVDPAARPAAASALVDCYLHQIFELGFYHGDPHPGNLFRMVDGRLCFHDFGIVGRVDPSMRRALLAFAGGFVEQDADWVVAAWKDLGFVEPVDDGRHLLRVVRELLADCAERPLREWSLAEAFATLVAAGRESGVRLPRELLVLTRTIVLLEGTVRLLDPDFSVFQSLLARIDAQPTLQAPQGVASSRRLRYELATTGADLPGWIVRHLRDALHRGRLLELSVVPAPAVLDVVDRASRRMAMAVIVVGLLIASSLLMQHGVGPKLEEIPVLAVVGYTLAGLFTWRVARRGSRRGA